MASMGSPCALVGLDMVEDCLIYIFKLSKFSATRWLAVGLSCRSMMASISVGLFDLAILALELKGSSESKLWHTSTWSMWRVGDEDDHECELKVKNELKALGVQLDQHGACLPSLEARLVAADRCIA